jgi:hypothetical protein
MSVVYLLLGGPDAFQKRDPWIGGIITPDYYHIFSIYDFMERVLIGNKSRKYVTNLWQTLSRQHPQFMEIQGTLGLAVPSSKMKKTEPKKGATAGTTVAGLQGVLNVLGNSVPDDCRKSVEDIFARYHAGDRSMLVFVNLNDKEHPQIPRFSYNFQPPTASTMPIPSIIIEDAEAGAAGPVSSRESSSTSTEFDFTSTEDHMVRARA